jgi:CTP:molybdopterin cytidylyltransferase MocA
MIVGAVLAAGFSSRMGRPKALLPLGPSGEPFVVWSARALLDGGAADAVVVAAREAEAIAAALDAARLTLRVILNPAPEGGQLSSLRVALDAVDRPGVSGLMIALVDMPLVGAATVRALIDAHRRTRAPIVRPVRAARHGHPVIFDRRLFDELRRADPDQGARAVVEAHRTEALDVPIEDEGAFADADTPEDYERLADRLDRGR